MCTRTCGDGMKYRVCIGGSERGKKESQRCNETPCTTIWTTTTTTTWIPPVTTTTTWIPPVTTTTTWVDPIVTTTTTWIPPVGAPVWVDHGCSQWGEWEMCTRTCGDGMKYRVCIGGSERGKKESQRCNERPCESWETTTTTPWIPTTTTTWIDSEKPGIVPPKEGCERWNDWSRCGKSCLRCRCCADAPDYNPPRPSLQVKRQLFEK